MGWSFQPIRVCRPVCPLVTNQYRTSSFSSSREDIAASEKDGKSSKPAVFPFPVNLAAFPIPW